ncbi:MAG: hypothetical protein HIU84_09925 [Acidobacteria bacterium]|nr:hypothetical protein [Acidobacteriota bacterium]
MLLLAIAAVVEPLLVPLKCIPINQLLNDSFGPVLSKAAGAVGGLLFGLAVVVTIATGLGALLSTFSKNSKEWIMKTFNPTGAIATTIIAISVITVVLNLFNDIACG